jgi:hypothetical protein
MANGEASERVILQLGAVLRGISPLIWRRLLVPSDTSIAQLHELLQVAFGWEDMHLQALSNRRRNAPNLEVISLKSESRRHSYCDEWGE